MLETLLHRGRADETNQRMTQAMVDLMPSESVPCLLATFAEEVKWRWIRLSDVRRRAVPQGYEDGAARSYMIAAGMRKLGSVRHVGLRKPTSTSEAAIVPT